VLWAFNSFEDETRTFPTPLELK